MSKLFRFVPALIPEDLKYAIKSREEEIANMVSHGIGFIIFTFSCPALIYKTFSIKTDGYFISSLIFSISLLMVYTSSTIYHSVYKVKLRRKLRVFDHISIYFLIAGSFTPFVMVSLKSQLGFIVLGVLWTMVLVGTIFKLFFTHRFNLISTIAYVGMGAMALFVISPLSEVLLPLSFNLLILGLASYLIGVPFYLWKTLYFNHFIWHIFVLIGSLCHFAAIYFML